MLGETVHLGFLAVWFITDSTEVTSQARVCEPFETDPITKFDMFV